MKCREMIQLLRPGNCLMASIAVLIGYFVVTKQFSIDLITAMVSAFLICGGGQVINDVFDAEIDKKVNPNKVIPSGRISKNNALIYSALLFVIGLGLALTISQIAFILTLIFSILLVIYAAFLYKAKYLGNIVVAAGIAFTFIYGAITAGEITALILFFAISAFFANMAREVTKDIEDLEKDRGFKKTLPMICGEEAKLAVFFYYFVSFLLALAIAIQLNLSIVYIFFITLSAGVFSLAFKELKEENPKKSQAMSKKGMLLSLIAYVSTILM